MSSSPYLLVPEAAELARTTPKTVYYWIAIGKLKARKPGKRVLLLRSELIALIEGCR